MGMRQQVVRGLALFACLGAFGDVAWAHVRQAPSPVFLPPLESPLAAGIETRQRRQVLYAQSNGLPPEQRQQMRQQMREHWQQMPPEQREAKRQDFRDRVQQMPPEERQRLREEIRERREGPERRGGGRGDSR